MAQNSRIEWTEGSAAVVTGCDYDGPGCKNCYAPRDAWRMAHNPRETLARRYAGTVEKTRAGKLVWTGRVNFNLDVLMQVLDTRKPTAWFVSHMGDLFHPSVTDEQVDLTMAVASLTPQHRYTILTKRSERMVAYFSNPDVWARIEAAARRLYKEKTGRQIAGKTLIGPLPNVLLGASVAVQKDADRHRPNLAKMAEMGWATAVSYEPALEPVDWTGFEFLAWMVSGGESRPGARESHPDCHRGARDFCAAHDIPYFFKQHGEFIHYDGAGRFADGAVAVTGGIANAPDGVSFRIVPPDFDLSKPQFLRVGKAAAGRMLDGVEHSALPRMPAPTPHEGAAR